MSVDAQTAYLFNATMSSYSVFPPTKLEQIFRGPPCPLLNMSSALVLSTLTAATAFSSIALASAAVPNCACANAEVESAANTAVPMRNLRSIVFPPMIKPRMMTVTLFNEGGKYVGVDLKHIQQGETCRMDKDVDGFANQRLDGCKPW
jgi:hypothetical protein